MQEKLLVYPNVELTYRHYPRVGLSGPAVLPDIEKRKYGYVLRVGQIVNCIRYIGSNQNFVTDALIKEIRDDGIVIQENYKFRKDFYPEELKDAFMPWVCDLPDGGKIEPRKMCIFPCRELYELNTMKDILAGNIPEEGYNRNGKPDGRGHGIWYQHGGWRTSASSYKQNLKNFVKLGQMSLFDNE